MRNLRRALSLALASVMVLGLMIVGSSALTSASETYDDYNDVDYKEALDVLTAADILDGFTDNQFSPWETLTREQAAKVLAVLHLGRAKADSLPKTATAFSDVDSTRWSAGYIGYCANLQLLAGNGDGTFNPEGTITGAQLGKMLLVALGYNPETEGYVNRPDWEINVSTDMTTANIDIDGVAMNEPITREQMAQMVLNTIKSPLVKYDSQTQVSVGDTNISIGGNQVSYVTATDGREENISTKKQTNSTSTSTVDSGTLVEFGEKFMTDLKQTEFGHDEFGRPTRTWSWKGEEIGTYVKTENLIGSYTTGVSGRTIYDLLGQQVLANSLSTDANDKFILSVDGKYASIDVDDADSYGTRYFPIRTAYYDSIIGKKTGTNTTLDNVKKNITSTFSRSNTSTIPVSGNGVLTEVYLDTDYKWENGTQVVITFTNTYVAKGSVSYKATDEKAEVNVYLNDSTGNKKDVALDLVSNATEITKDKYYLVNISYADYDPSDYNTSKAGDIVAVQTPDILENSSLTKFSKRNVLTASQTVINSLTTDGTQYYGAEKSYYDIAQLDKYGESYLTNNTYNVYIDQYGYAIGVSKYSGSDNYVFITGYDLPGSNLANSTAEALGIFTDGTKKNIEVDVSAWNDAVDNNNWTSLQRKQYLKWDGKEDPDVPKGNEGQYKINPDTGSQEAIKGSSSGNPVLNRWYSYTVNKDGIYKLSPVKMNMYKESTTWTPAPVINPTHIRVDENVFTDQYRAYGEDDSIYITVGLGDVDTNNESSITKINGVVTGVQNINIQIGKGEKTEAYKYVPQIYTVYDKNNYIIASIVIGKAVGAVDNIAYILGEVDSEGITEDGSYLYTFDAIVNGKIQSVTAKGDYKGAFDNTIINSGNGVRLFYDADGYVTSIEKLTKDEIHDLTETENSNEIKDEDVYWIGIQSDRTIHLQGRTLYLTDNQNDTGLTINTASAIVRQYDENLDRATTVEYDSVAEAFENLKDNASELDGKQFKGTIYAALDSNGIASWIIFDAEKTDTPISFS